MAGKERLIFNKSNSFSDFKVTNLNKSSKKIDFSIVEQRVEPIEIFTNLSECDLRESIPRERINKSSLERIHPLEKKDCNSCKLYEKQYFRTEGKYLKALDKIKQLKMHVEI
jgi:hypothetical protein